MRFKSLKVSITEKETEFIESIHNVSYSFEGDAPAASRFLKVTLKILQDKIKDFAATPERRK